jgi:hypothetical protein
VPVTEAMYALLKLVDPAYEQLAARNSAAGGGAR